MVFVKTRLPHAGKTHAGVQVLGRSGAVGLNIIPVGSPMQARDMLARAEWRRRKLTKRLKEEEDRIEEDEADTRKRLKTSREHHKKWEETRETRVGTWRDFAKKKGKKARAWASVYRDIGS